MNGFAPPFDRFVGVGLGIDVHNAQPDWRAALASLPLDFLEVYTRGDVAGAREVRAAAGDLPLLYHDDALDPILPEGLGARELELAVENMRATGAPWCVSELATRRLGQRYLDFFLPIVLTAEAADVAAANLRRLDEALPGRVAAENPPYQLPVGPLHVLELMARVHERADVPLVLDLGHLYSFQLCKGAGPLEALDALPLEAVIELHLAGATVDTRRGTPVYQDAHGAAELLPVLLEMLAEVAPRCPNLRAITIEVEDGPLERVERQLAATRAAVAGLLAGRA
ncbi:MAG: DUF692 family multinuclear iron-containing protein [Planctomycetota bacterium]